MTWSPSTPVTGGAQTGFTTPTYTLAADRAPDINGTQHAVSAVGGTQAGVRSHTVSDPFTVTFFKPKTPKALPSPNPTTGRYGSVPSNTYSVVLRKGVNFAANQAPVVMTFRLTMDIPAGADSYDAAQIRAAVSLLSGLLTQIPAGVGDSLVTGIP